MINNFSILDCKVTTMHMLQHSSSSVVFLINFNPDASLKVCNLIFDKGFVIISAICSAVGQYCTSIT